MSRIQSTFETLQRRSEPAFIAYIMAGDPSLDLTESIVLTLANAGADLIELGVPFSDPVADGPTIQKASERSLQAKTSLRMILDKVASIRRQSDIPLLLMSYLNPILRMGVDVFLRRAHDVGVDGLIIPDLPVEEGDELSHRAEEEGLDLIFLAAPTTDRKRMKRIASVSSGFLYYVSITGITGAALAEMEDVTRRLSDLKRITSLPVAVGFGISTPEEARALGQVADGIVVGSAIVKLVEQGGPTSEILRRVDEYGRSMKAALRYPPHS